MIRSFPVAKLEQGRALVCLFVLPFARPLVLDGNYDATMNALDIRQLPDQSKRFDVQAYRHFRLIKLAAAGSHL